MLHQLDTQDIMINVGGNHPGNIVSIPHFNPSLDSFLF